MLQKYLIRGVALGWLTGLLAGCTSSEDQGQWKVEKKELKTVEIDIQRLEERIYRQDSMPVSQRFEALRSQDSLVFELFVERILGLPGDRRQVWARELERWASNADMRKVYQDIQEAYPTLDDLERDLELAFGRHHHFFPEDTIPRFYSMMTAFTYQVVTYPELVGISLDMFLGKQYRFYPTVGFPDYKILRLQEPYIVPSVMKAWFSKQYPDQAYIDNTLLSRMIHQGKALAYLDAILPNTADTLKIEYSGQQWAWAENSEPQIWTHFVEEDLLYNTTPDTRQRYMDDGPFTLANGVPQKSAPRLGEYIGWKIVKSYLDAHPEVDLPTLLRNKDYQQILNESQYKPKQ